MACRTVPEDADLQRVRRGAWARRLTMIVIAAIVAAGLGGWLGVRLRTVTTTGDGYDLTVTYPEISRPGRDTRLQVRVRRDGGWRDDEVVTLAMNQAYLDLFDENSVDPEASTATTSDGLVVWEFDPPTGDMLIVTFDTRVSPSRQWGGRGRVLVLEDDEPAAEVRFRTRMLP